MAFKQKTWTNRVAEFINRRLLTYEDGRTELVTVARSEGTVSVEGDGFNDDNMNDLEQRIADEFSELNNAIGNIGFSIDTNNILVERTPFKSQTVTYTATEKCFAIIEILVQFTASGAGTIKLNDVTLFDTSSQKYEWFCIPLSKDDVLTLYTNSTGNSYYGVYGVK